MKEEDCTFGEYRWEKVLQPLESPEPILQLTPAPSLLCAELCSLWLGRRSALQSSSQPLQLTNSWPRISSNRNFKNKKKFELHLNFCHREAQDSFFFTSWVLGRPGFYLCWTQCCMCLIWQSGVTWEAGIFRFKGLRGFGCLEKF